MARPRTCRAPFSRARLPSHAVTQPPDRAAMQAVVRDLLDAHQVAELLGISGATSVRAYASMNSDFPRPVLPHDPRPGSASYWGPPDIVAWRAPPPPRRRPDPTVTPPS